MTLVITLTTAGADTGPFNLFSDFDGYVNAFAINIPKDSLLIGYVSNNVPEGTTIVRVKSINHNCFVQVDVNVPTTTTTTTAAPTTTTTTTASGGCNEMVLQNNSASDITFSYIPCGGGNRVYVLVTSNSTADAFCAQFSSIEDASGLTLISSEYCPGGTTTTTTTINP
jgi:hypothetical protein